MTFQVPSNSCNWNVASVVGAASAELGSTSPGSGSCVFGST